MIAVWFTMYNLLICEWRVGFVMNRERQTERERETLELMISLSSYWKMWAAFPNQQQMKTLTSNFEKANTGKGQTSLNSVFYPRGTTAIQKHNGHFSL